MTPQIISQKNKIIKNNLKLLNQISSFEWLVLLCLMKDTIF
jgi:hypothetical protein